MGLGLQHTASGRIKTFSPWQRERREALSINFLKDLRATCGKSVPGQKKGIDLKAQVDRQQATKEPGVKKKEMRTPRKGAGVTIATFPVYAFVQSWSPFGGALRI